MLKLGAAKRIAAWGMAACLCGVAAAAVPLAAQSSDTAPSRAVVQPLPPAGVEDLNIALMRLARNSRDLDALIDAGNASLKLNDLDAAIGFFGRADELSPGNSRVKVGLAGAFVRSDRPIEALRLFDEAELAGASSVALEQERGLAYDLVGDPASAQAQYARALAVRPSDELIRQMALSQAISGDRAAFEKTLLPLLERRDLAAYRTRAFALAILGDEAEAVAIAEAVMPAELSARMTPYLRYMKRLTRAQQAAAGNLGNFPRAARIGRDDPRTAQYSGVAAGNTSAADPVRTADAGLAPRGEPLGSARNDKASPRRRPDRGTSAVSPSSITVPATETRPASKPAPPPSAPAARLGLDLAPVANGSSAASAASAPPETAPVPAQEPTSVADAFASFGVDSVSPNRAGAVDISAIKPKREIAAKPKAEAKPAAKPEPPRNPSRIWVQVATGRDRNALAFDWRRISRKSPDVLGEKATPAVKPHLASWGQATRLLAGPFASEKAARTAVSALKAKGVDSFIFTSSAGQEVDELP